MYNPQKAHYIAVTGIIVKDGKFLIVKRSPTEKVFPNRWTVPGGKLEVKDYSERPKDTENSWHNIFEDVLRREVMEETSLKVRDIKYLTSLTFMRPDNIPTVVISFLANHDEGDVKLCKDLSEHSWVTLEEAKNYNLYGGIYDEMCMVDKILKGEKVDIWEKADK